MEFLDELSVLAYKAGLQKETLINLMKGEYNQNALNKYLDWRSKNNQPGEPKRYDWSELEVETVEEEERRSDSEIDSTADGARSDSDTLEKVDVSDAAAEPVEVSESEPPAEDPEHDAAAEVPAPDLPAEEPEPEPEPAEEPEPEPAEEPEPEPTNPPEPAPQPELVAAEAPAGSRSNDAGDEG